MPSNQPLFLAIDLGTSSARTALFDHRLRRVPGSLAQRAHSVSYGDDGKAELNTEALEANLRHCLDHTVPRAGNRLVSDIGFSCFWHSLVGVDSCGQALTPVYTWADSRCREDAARLREEHPERQYHARTGCMLRASYWPAKLRWLARTDSGLWRRVPRWESPADWLQSRCCEPVRRTTSHGMATGTGLYNPNTLAWDREMVELAGLREDQLPTIGMKPLALRDDFRLQYPPLRDARWWPAIGDGAASNLGSGATQPGFAAINVGTSAAFRLMRRGKEAQAPFGLFCYRVDAERYLVGGAVSNAGNLRAWCRRELRLSSSQKTLDAALATRLGPITSLAVLPFWSAERAPTWCEELSGVITGLTQHTSALDLLQATTEAVYHRLALIADLSLEESSDHRAEGIPTRPKIIVSGGILKSDSLVQRLADVLGRPLHRCAEPEASLLGAAVYAAERSGFNVDAVESQVRSETDGILPRGNLASQYAQERARQVRLEAAMVSTAND